jgi:hypothetical protein
VRIHVPWTPELPSRYATSPVPQLSSLLRYPKAGVSGSGPQTLGASSRLLEASSDYSLPSSVAGFSFDGHATSSNRREVRPLTLADQAEEQMNYMIRCLVNIISGYLNKPGLSPAIFQSTSPIRARPIVGDGAQISTKPDLYITVISSGKVYIARLQDTSLWKIFQILYQRITGEETQIHDDSCSKARSTSMPYT